MSSVDAMLYRPLKSGNQYNGLIPPYQGQEHNFDKESDNSTTYDTLKYMAQWSNKYAYQMKRIAPLLKGRTIQETANNIYQFLYNHFQYKLDGSLQNLYSPSAAWHFRKTGFDCKTYSLLASCILQNLNITHYFRMVQQAGIMPGEWSHVYVIVPDNNKEYVIDATTHTNKQVSFTKKYDYIMQHLGLASPAVYGLGCACQGKKITRNGLGAPATLNDTVSNFHLFLDELEKRGVPKAQTDKMLELVRYNVERGIDPNMQEIVSKAILPAGNLGAPTFGSGSGSLGLNFGDLLSGGASGGVGGVTKSLVGNMSVGGVKVGSIVSAATGLLTGNPLAVLGLVKSLIPMEKTFGAVFANGFDLGCWGSSFTPSGLKAVGEKDFPMVLNETLGKGITEDNLHLYVDAMNHAIAQARANVPSFKACSAKGLSQFADAAEKAKEGVVEGVRTALEQKNIKLERMVDQGRTTNFTFPFKFSEDLFNMSTDATYPRERYKIIVPLPPPPPPSNNSNQGNQGNQNSNATNGNQGSGSSSSAGLLLGGALLALKLLL